ncbi:unnamed protein product [Cladocopium goreaui]|uniref:Elongation of fatty acids protein n=1 Tax=Cladocopium goreaui TaxID=2562237 RepID=A0A9P1GNW8_9DINO|nr:unnamed protein product [Cladocopium goreaui]
MYYDFDWKNAPLSSRSSPVVTGVLYLLMVFILPRYVPMGGYKLERLLVVHNFILSAMSLVMCVGCAWEMFERVRHENADWMFCEDPATPARGPLYFWSYAFYVSKYYELIDTLLAILRSSRPPHFGLHVYHHALVPVMVWNWLEYRMNLQHIGLLWNTFVHVVMYAYYGFKAMEKLGHTTPNSAIPDERGIRGDGHEDDVGAESRAMKDESISDFTCSIQHFRCEALMKLHLEFHRAQRTDSNISGLCAFVALLFLPRCMGDADQLPGGFKSWFVLSGYPVLSAFGVQKRYLLDIAASEVTTDATFRYKSFTWRTSAGNRHPYEYIIAQQPAGGGTARDALTAVEENLPSPASGWTLVLIPSVSLVCSGKEEMRPLATLLSQRGHRCYILEWPGWTQDVQTNWALEHCKPECLAEEYQDFWCQALDHVAQQELLLAKGSQEREEAAEKAPQLCVVAANSSAIYGLRALEALWCDNHRT